MTGQSIQPELIITLSRNKVDVRLLAVPDKRETSWQKSFPISGNFADDQVSDALDKALQDNPDLLDQFPCVHLLIMDRPSVSLPSYVLRDGRGSKVVLRHLRARLGDQLNVDPTIQANALCYSVPENTITVLHEYYHTIGKIHIMSLLHKALSDYSQMGHPKEGFYAGCFGNTLYVISVQNGKFIFSKTFEVRQLSDLHYFVVACKKLLDAHQSYWVEIRDESNQYGEPNESFLKFDERIILPSLSSLLMQYNRCVS